MKKESIVIIFTILIVLLISVVIENEKTADISLRSIHEINTTMYDCEGAGACSFPNFKF